MDANQSAEHPAKGSSREHVTGQKPRPVRRSGTPQRWSRVSAKVLEGLGAPDAVARALQQMAGVSLMLAGASLLPTHRRRQVRKGLLAELERLTEVIRPWASELPRLLRRDLRNGLLMAGLPAPLVADVTASTRRAVNHAALNGGANVLLVRHSHASKP